MLATFAALITALEPQNTFIAQTLRTFFFLFGLSRFDGLMNFIGKGMNEQNSFCS